MTALAVLEATDLVLISGIVLVFGGITAFAARQRVDLRRLESQLTAVQLRLDALLKHHRIELPQPPPSGLSPEVERLALSPETKIEAIKLYRDQNPGVGLAEAKQKIESFASHRRAAASPLGKG